MATRQPGSVTAPGTVRFERDLPGPIERVWRYLTDPDLRGTWLAAGPMDLRVGGAVELHFRHADLSPQKVPVPKRYAAVADGHLMHGRITRLEPPRLLAYTWSEERGEPSEVTFELEPRGERVRLVVTHQRLDGRAAMVSVASGWHTHLDILADRLDGRDPPPFWTAHAEREADYERRLPDDPAAA